MSWGINISSGGWSGTIHIPKEGRPRVDYYHRDGTPADTFTHTWDPASPDYARVAATRVGGIRVSTVFLALDHNFGGKGPPVLFETMIFGARGRWAEFQTRYCTEAEALAGHAMYVEAIAGTKHPRCSKCGQFAHPVVGPEGQTAYVVCSIHGAADAIVPKIEEEPDIEFPLPS